MPHRAGILRAEDLPKKAVQLLGETSSARIGRMVKDVVEATFAGDLSEIRMSSEILDATLELRKFLFTAVYENDTATAEFKKASGVLGGLWEKIRERPQEFLDQRTIDEEGIDAAARDFLAGMTDRYAVSCSRGCTFPSRGWGRSKSTHRVASRQSIGPKRLPEALQVAPHGTDVEEWSARAVCFMSLRDRHGFVGERKARAIRGN